MLKMCFRKVYNIAKFPYIYFKSLIVGPILVKKLVNKYINSKDEDDLIFCHYLQRYNNYSKKFFIGNIPFFFTFGNDYVFDYLNRSYKVSYQFGFPYVIYKNKPMFMPKEMSEYEIISYIMGIDIEQDKKSPHCYFPDSIDLTDKVLVDVGAAEGNFAIEHIDRIKFLGSSEKLWLVKKY